MEFEQIIKRLDWLDEEHRKDSNTIDVLNQRTESLEAELITASKKIKELSANLSNLNSTAARIEQFDAALIQQRTEIVKFIEDLDNKRQEQQPEIDKRYQIQFATINKTLDQFQKTKELVGEIKRELKSRAEEDTRRYKLIADWETRMKGMVNTVEEVQRAQTSAEEPRRQDSKRLLDLQGDLNTARKRLDEALKKNDLFTDNIRRIESRLNEIMINEGERRQVQVNLLESQARSQMELDRTTKEWEGKLNDIRRQSELLDHNLQEWETAQRSFKHIQESYEEILQRFERRINEITEIQRLAEDRFRQEWMTYKADEQKRWTSFTLTQDENIKDTHNDLAKVDDRLTALADLTQTHQDVLQMTKEANEQLFQGMLAQIHELLSAYERIMGGKG
jgi:chromosome segregation ATPase